MQDLTPTLDFLQQHAPFNAMAQPDLLFLAKNLALAFYQQDEIITEQDQKVERLYIIKQGRIQGEIAGNAVWELGIGETFPLGALLSNRPVKTKHRAVEDTFCFVLKKADFEILLQQSCVFHDFCTRRLASLLEHTQKEKIFTADTSLNIPLIKIIRRDPVSCLPDTSIREVLCILQQEKIGSIIITNRGLLPLGIFTLHDLLERVALAEVSLDLSIEEVMTKDPKALSPQAFAFEAAILMAKHGFSHVCVVEEDRLIGVVSERDLFALQRIGLVNLTRSLQQAENIEALKKLSHDIRSLCLQMLGQGVKTEQVIQINAALNDNLTQRILHLYQEKFNIDIPFVWLAFGSEARFEQTLFTDQDNGIAFLSEHPDETRKVFLPFAKAVNHALAECGFTLCPGNIMASNPECCLSITEWYKRFDTWIEQGTPEHLLKASIFFDVRALYGSPELVSEILLEIQHKVTQTPRFLMFLAEEALRFHAPLGFMDNIIVSHKGPHANTLNIKKEGLAVFVAAARVFALANNITKTNTTERFQALINKDVMPNSEVLAWLDAHKFLQNLKMRLHAEKIQKGEDLDNYLNPEHLSPLEKRILKEALRQARKIQARLRLDYQV